MFTLAWTIWKANAELRPLRLVLTEFDRFIAVLEYIWHHLFTHKFKDRVKSSIAPC